MDNEKASSTPEDRAAGSLSALAADFSLESTPGEIKKNPGALSAALAPGTRVFITFLEGRSFDDTVAAAEQVVTEGMVPVPHVAIRAIPDRAALDSMFGRLTELGVAEILAIAGSVPVAAGEYSETAQILESGALETYGIRRVGVAGHPEGNPGVDDALVAKALADKNRIAEERPFEVHLVTQFCFAPEPIVEWERRIREEGNRLPITIGLPGLASPAALVKYGLACGVGASLKVLRKQSGGLLKMATKSTYYPDKTMTGIAESMEADPESLIRGVHYFPFGTLERTSAWARDLVENAGSPGEPLTATG